MTEPGAESAEESIDESVDESVDVLVIGGGIAGLVTAWELTRLGRSPLVLEAGPELGGCVGVHEVGGLRLDSGAESYAIARPSVLALAADLGLADRVVAPAALGSWAWTGGAAIPLPPAGLLGVPVHPLSRPVRRALGPVGSARAALDRLLPAAVGAGRPDEPEAFGRIVRARMGRRVVERLVEPVVGGVHSASPDSLDADVIAPGLRAALRERGSLAAAVAQLRKPMGPAGAAVRGLAGGVHQLIDALVEQLPHRIRTRAAVTSLAQRDAGDGRGGWRASVAGPDGTTSTIAARAVVLAVPAPVAAGLLRPTLTAGTGAVGDGLAALASPDTTDVVLATIVIDEPLLDAAPRGTGILVARQATDVAAKALTHATAKWPWLARQAGPGRHVLRLSYGRGGEGGDGAAAPQAAPAPELLRATALADAATLLGVSLDPGRVVDFAIQPWSSALPRPGTGHAARVRALNTQLSEHPGALITGAWIAGNGLAAVVADARRTAGLLVAG